MEPINDLKTYFQNITQERMIHILIALAIILVSILFSSIFSYLIIKIFKRKEKDKKKIKSNAFYFPLKLAFIILGIYIATMLLELPISIRLIIYKILEIITICIVAKGISNLFMPNSNLMRKIANNERMSGNRSLVNFSGKIAKFIIYTISGMLIISALDYNINGIITGLGLGSVVIALAAQDLAKSILAGVAILVDKPFKVGDWVQTTTCEGTVVDITFRSTRIKTTEDTTVAIPNSKLIEEAVVNYAKIQKRRYTTDLKLPLQTNSDTVETIINRIKFVLEHDNEVIKDSIIVECNSILADGINILVALNTTITDYTNYLTFRTKVNKAILKILESEEIRLSNPTQDIYMKKIE